MAEIDASKGWKAFRGNALRTTLPHTEYYAAAPGMWNDA